MQPTSSHRTIAQNRRPIQNFVDQLVHPPSLFNPLRKSSSQRNILDQDSGSVTPIIVPRPSPNKHRSKSQDKPSSIFTNSKIYTDPFSSQNSVVVMKLSEMEDIPTINLPQKTVRFRESLITRNQHNRRDHTPIDCQTPSILKRSQALRQKTIQRLQSNLNSSHNSVLDRQSMMMNEDKQARATRTNEVVKRRYSTINQRFEAKFSQKIRTGAYLRTDQKYKDELFPPIMSSIFRGGIVKNQQLKGSAIRWMRLPQLFKDRRLCVLPRNRSGVQIYCNKWKDCGNFIGEAFTAIKDCKYLLRQIFQSQQVNQFGVYAVKIFQENVWKYVIVDDLIPTVKDQHGNSVPLFVNICQVSRRDQPIQLWPFLLQKAYANYYANYQSLHSGNALDFLQQITGSPSEEFKYSVNLKVMEEIMNRLGTYLQRDNTIFMGYIQQMQTHIPIYKNSRGRIVAKRSFQAQTEEVVINIDNIFDYFDNVFVISPMKWQHSAVSTVGLNMKRTSNENSRFDISLRVLKVTKNGQVAISIRQKEKRFYKTSSLNYNYFWNRLLIFQKEFDGDCRWITGKYSSQKTINFIDNFQAGEYYLIFLPEWKVSHCYELSIIVLSTSPISLIRRQYDDKQKLIEKGCADLAQRKGKLQQISMYACSYCTVNQDVGLMIENINNQRFNGDIRINRSIGTVKGLATVVPFNLEFYQNKSSKMPFKTNISIFIHVDQTYTVVLMTRSGIDKKLLKRFDFTK